MTDQNNFDDENLDGTQTGETEGKGKAGGTSGKGKTGTGDNGADTGIAVARFSRQGIKLPPGKLKEVMGNWEYLDVARAMARVAEFFSEFPARASAHAVVSWGKDQGYAIINHAVAFGQEVAFLMRDRTAGHIKTLRTKYGIKVPRANTSTPNAGPGMV